MEGKSTKLPPVSPVKKTAYNRSHHLITLAAFRYALGRETYVVSEVVDWIIDNWKEIPQETLKIIIDETEDSLMLGFCSKECDQQDWERLLKFAEKKTKFV